MPHKAAKPVNPRAVSDQAHSASMAIKNTPTIGCKITEIKAIEHPILMENSSNNESSDDHVKELVQERKLPPELRLSCFLINAATFLEKEFTFCFSKRINLHQ